MSGILGILRRDGAPVDRSLLRSLLGSFTEYAPDGQQVWVSGTVGLGHALLQTTEESSGERQPASVDGRFWITGDVRLDSGSDLRRELASAGRTCRSNSSDSELILDAYAAWGEACVDHLRGDFSFAIWDARETRLFCARDHFGIKPFYYATLREGFVFSNALGCLRLLRGISGELNEQAIADFLLFGANYDLGSTAFRDIHRLAPAHSLTVSAEKLSIRRYWYPPVDGRVRYRHADEYVEHFQLLMRSAVADRLRTPRAGILLSGGLDSSAVAATARELSTGGTGAADLRAYTVTYESVLPDQDGKYARELAAFFQIPIRCLPMDQLELFERWVDPRTTWPEPVEDPFFAGLFDQTRAIASECRVVLSGEGSDNLMHFEMWPYVRYRMRRREWLDVLSELGRYWRMRPPIGPGIRRRLRRIFRGDPGAAQFPSWISPELAKRFDLRDRWRELTGVCASPPHPVVPAAHASLLLPQWSQRFELESAGVTGYPLEVRYPFLDLRIVNYILALPPFPWCLQKTLLREAMLGHLPERIRLRRKTPFAGDLLAEKLRRREAAWLEQAPWSPEMDRYVGRSALPQLGFESASEGKEKSRRPWMDIRPLCLNFWLQSPRGVRYNLLAEVHNA